METSTGAISQIISHKYVQLQAMTPNHQRSPTLLVAKQEAVGTHQWPASSLMSLCLEQPPR